LHAIIIVYRASHDSRDASHSQKRREPIGIRNAARGPLEIILRNQKEG
jgi:hypothetical protein